MIALDSSVVIASFGPWHEHHTAARQILDGRPRLPVHASLEAYSVLTRLPEPFRAEPHLVAEFLRRTFTTERLALSVEEHAALPTRLGRTRDLRRCGPRRAHRPHRRCGGGRTPHAGSTGPRDLRAVPGTGPSPGLIWFATGGCGMTSAVEHRRNLASALVTNGAAASGQHRPSTQELDRSHSAIPAGFASDARCRVASVRSTAGRV